MDDELRYVIIDENFKDMSNLAALFREAFPPEERFIEPENALRQLRRFPNLKAVAVYDGETPAGFYNLTVNEEMGYVYGNYLAVNSTVRSKGYGTRILQKILSDYRDKIFMGSIEKPVPGEAGYENKIRRQRFYERNGLTVTDREDVSNGVILIPITSQTGEHFEKCYDDAMREVHRQIDTVQ